jgi:hypothetical protein
MQAVSDDTRKNNVLHSGMYTTSDTSPPLPPVSLFKLWRQSEYSTHTQTHTAGNMNACERERGGHPALQCHSSD